MEGIEGKMQGGVKEGMWIPLWAGHVEENRKMWAGARVSLQFETQETPAPVHVPVTS